MLSENDKRILEEAERIKKRQAMEALEAGESRPSYRRDMQSEYVEDRGRGSRYANSGALPPDDEEKRIYEAERRRLQEEQQEQPPRKKKHRFLRFLGSLLLAALILLAAAVFFIYIMTGKAKIMDMSSVQDRAEWGLPEAGRNGVTNILLIGTDARVSDEDSRSDAIIVASISPKKRRVTLISILRDSYVTIPGYGENRINHAFQMGGARLLIETIEMNFHIRIDHYVKVDFYSFIDIIDALGGVDIDVTDEEVHYVNAYLSEINHLINVDPQDSFIDKGGSYHFSGKQALAYARIRYIGTDFGRTERQRTVLKAAVQSAKKHPFRTLAASGKIFSSITTGMSQSEMTLMILKSPIYANYEMRMEHVPIDGYWWNALTPEGQEVLGIDFESTSALLYDMIYK